MEHAAKLPLTLSVSKYCSALLANAAERLGPLGSSFGAAPSSSCGIGSVCGSASRDMHSDANSIKRTISCAFQGAFASVNVFSMWLYAVLRANTRAQTFIHADVAHLFNLA